MRGAGCEGCCGGRRGLGHHCERHTTTVHTRAHVGVCHQPLPAPLTPELRGAPSEITRSREREREKKTPQHKQHDILHRWSPPPPPRKPLWTWVDSFHPTLLQSECSEIVKPPNEAHLGECIPLKDRALCRCRLSSPGELKGRTER